MSNAVKKGISLLLLPVSALYGLVVGVRNILFDLGIRKSESFDLPIICIGNLTVGGTGKTPHTEFLVSQLYEKFHIAVLSRGYKRKTRGFQIADMESTAKEIGDEPYQIKQKFPGITVAVCRQRAKGIKQLLADKGQTPPEVILLDDAYQHRRVKAGLNILLTDYNRPIYNDCLMPTGRLRESFGGRRRAHIVVVTKCPSNLSAEEAKRIEQALRLQKEQKLFFSTLNYGSLISVWGDTQRELSTLSAETQVFLLTGIAHPEPIMDKLKSTGVKITSIRYPDHHHFTPGDISHINKIFNSMKKNGEAIIITTEKDASRLKFCQGLSESVLKHLYYLPIEIKILNNEQSTFNHIINEYIRQDSRDSKMDEEPNR